MVSQVAGDGIGGGRQQAFPLYFKMAYGRSVASARVVALGSLNILGESGHVTVVGVMFFYKSRLALQGLCVDGNGFRLDLFIPPMKQLIKQRQN